jgi:phage-related protein
MLFKQFGFQIFKVKKTKWRGTHNIDVSAKKIFSIKSKNDALQLAEIYLKNFLVDNTPGEIKILDIWLQGFNKQLSLSCSIE